MSWSWTFTSDDVAEWLAISHDVNPTYARDDIAPPLLCLQGVGQHLGRVLDGLGLSRQVCFHAEQFVEVDGLLAVGDEVETTLAIGELIPYGLGAGLVVNGRVTSSRGRVAQARGVVAIPQVRPPVAVSAISRGSPVAQAPGPTWTRTDRIEMDLPARFARLSGDVNPVHLDDGFAREAGLPGVILHGLCSMAMGTAFIVDAAAGGDPRLFRSCTMRFSRPVLPGDDVEWRLGQTEMPGGFALRAEVNGRAAIRNGLAVIGEAPGSPGAL